MARPSSAASSASGRRRNSPTRSCSPAAPRCPTRHARIVDPVTGDDVPIGQVGDIAIGGGHMLGYWGRPEQTEKVVRGGFLFTGDVGRMDSDGYVYVRGRSSERLMVRGEPWYPRDVEEALMEHPGVAAAALIGIPDAELGERPLAHVIARDQATASNAELVSFAATGLGRDLSDLEIRRVPSLPLTPTGKISKAELKANVLSSMAEPSP